MSKTQISAPPGVPFIDLTREFEAPRDLVFQAYTDRDLLVQWMGPRKYEMVIDTWEPRPGGSWRFVHKDAENEWGFHGVFHGDQTADRMTQTFEFEGAPGHVSLETLTLEEHDGRTTVRTHSVFQSVADRDAMVQSGMEDGTNEGFDRLDELLARLATPV